MEQLRQLLEEIPFYRTADDKTRRLMESCAVVRHYRKHDYLFRMRDPVDHLVVMASGYAVLERDSDDHGNKSVFLLSAGEIANEVILDYSTASVSCYALSEVTAVLFPRVRFVALMQQDYAIASCVIHSMASKIRRLYHQVESSTKQTRVGHQVAARIWKFGRDHGVVSEGIDGETVVLPFEVRITLLASFVGSNRETVSRIIRQMNEEHILSIRNGVCTIYDMEALHQFY